MSCFPEVSGSNFGRQAGYSEVSVVVLSSSRLGMVNYFRSSVKWGHLEAIATWKASREKKNVVSSMEQGSVGADSRPVGQEISHLSWDHKIHYRVCKTRRWISHVVRVRASVFEAFVVFCMILVFDGELLVTHQTLKLLNHHLFAVCECLFNIFASVLHIWRHVLHLWPQNVLRATQKLIPKFCT
jgi:hypothetical protein